MDPSPLVLQLANSSTLTSLLPSLGSAGLGAAVGGALGWVAKKLFKLIVAVVSIFILAPLAFLNYKGIITVNWSAMYMWLETSASWAYQTIGAVASISIPGLGGFAVAFAAVFARS